MHGARIFRACSGQRNRGLERHATTRTGSGFAGTDLRTHRANVGRLISGSRVRNWSRWSRMGGRHVQRNQAGGRRTGSLGQVFLWIRFEFLGAGGATKIDSFSSVIEVVLCGRRVHGHAANRIFHSGRRIGNVILHALAGFWPRDSGEEPPGRGVRGSGLRGLRRLLKLAF
jgi:hypothetical protein